MPKVLWRTKDETPNSTSNSYGCKNYNKIEAFPKTSAQNKTNEIAPQLADQVIRFNESIAYVSAFSKQISRSSITC